MGRGSLAFGGVSPLRAPDRPLAAGVQANEPGALLYTDAQAGLNPLTFVHYSVYRDEAELQTQLNTLELWRLFGTVEFALVESVRFERYEVMDAAAHP